MSIKVGVCGFPASLEKLNELLDVIEVQKTFYTIPETKAVENWKKKAPKVIWSVKANQIITHSISSPTYRKCNLKLTEEERTMAGEFKLNELTMKIYQNILEIGLTLDARFILFQTPLSFKMTKENVERIYKFFETVKRPPGIKFLLEPRGWGGDTLKKLLEELSLIHVVDPFKEKKVYGDITYYRLHGVGGYSYSYSEGELFNLKEIAEDNSHILFNNTDMLNNAVALRKLLLSSY